MGRTRPGRKKQVVPSRLSTQQNSSPEPSISSLLAKAQALAGECDYDLAHSFTERILQRDKDNTDAKELLGVIQLEMGDIDAAKQASSTCFFL
jgi:Flp pilus assembly protein TadD